MQIVMSEYQVAASYIRGTNLKRPGFLLIKELFLN